VNFSSLVHNSRIEVELTTADLTGRQFMPLITAKVRVTCTMSIMRIEQSFGLQPTRDSREKSMRKGL